MNDVLLKTQQVAQALQVGVSTVKRWVDAGELTAIRTVGNHRLIPLPEAIRFAKGRNLPTTALERMTRGRDGSKQVETIDTVDESVRLRLFGYLREGDAANARALILGCWERLGSTSRLADELIHPVMDRVGHGWMVGAWEIYQEHQASQIVGGCLAELASRIPAASGERLPLALGATPQGDLYSLALALGELTLREQGWDVRNLGPNLPLDSLTEAVRTYRPRMVFLSISNLSDPASFLRGYERFHEVASGLGAAVILGGRALTPELRYRLRYTAFGDRLEHLAEFGRRLSASPTPDQRESSPISASSVDSSTPLT